MSDFVIPTDDPGSPRFQTYPDVIRGTTIQTFLERDRFVFTTSRRLIVSVPHYRATNLATHIIAAGQSKTSAILTGYFWIVAQGRKGTLAVTFGGSTHTHTFLTTPSPLKWGVLVNTTLTANSWAPFAVSWTQTDTTPGAGFDGLAIYEERLPPSLLP